MQSALDYICGQSTFSCAPINQGGAAYYPNTVQDHASWAINAWYQKYPINPSKSCNFGYTAFLMCENCTCDLFPNATDTDLQNALTYVCANFNCTPIQPGGSNYLPNTLAAHTAWAVNAWYQAFNWTFEACQFNGIAYLTPVQCTGTPGFFKQKLISDFI